MSDLPLKFVAHYEAECGDSIEMWNCKFPKVKFYCEDCREAHSYFFVYLEHRVWEWDIVQDIWAEEGGVTDPYASGD